MKNRSVPTDAVVPHLVYSSLTDASEWLTRTLGFQEHFRYGEPLSGMQMLLNNACIMLMAPRPGAQTPRTLGHRLQPLTVIVPDAAAHFDRAKREGALIWEDLQETVYGERQYGAEDLDGHRWLFSEHVRDLHPSDWGATIAKDRV